MNSLMEVISRPMQMPEIGNTLTVSLRHENENEFEHFPMLYVTTISQDGSITVSPINGKNIRSWHWKMESLIKDKFLVQIEYKKNGFYLNVQKHVFESLKKADGLGPVILRTEVGGVAEEKEIEGLLNLQLNSDSGNTLFLRCYDTFQKHCIAQYEQHQKNKSANANVGNGTQSAQEVGQRSARVQLAPVQRQPNPQTECCTIQ